MVRKISEEETRKNPYEEESFFKSYSQMARSREGLQACGEWHQLQPLFPDLGGAAVLDLGCGYGWHCKYAADCGASSVLGIDISERLKISLMAYFQSTVLCRSDPKL